MIFSLQYSFMLKNLSFIHFKFKYIDIIALVEVNLDVDLCVTTYLKYNGTSLTRSLFIFKKSFKV